MLLKRRSFGYCALILAISALLSSHVDSVSGSNERAVVKDGEFILTLSADKDVYSPGETPKFTATIENRSAEEAYVVPALDGSADGMRYPIVQFEVTRPKGATPLELFGRCGNTNNISPSDFLRVPPKQSVDIQGWARVRQGTFSDEGKYSITLTYSTEGENETWYGFMGPLKKKRKIDELLSEVPTMTLTSNTVSISVE